MPGSVLSTKREIAISAPVLPARDARLRGPSLTRLIGDAHRRVLLVSQRIGGRLVHLDHFAGRLHGDPVAGDRAASPATA